MQETFFTILAIWVVWRLYSSFSTNRNAAQGPRYSATHHHYYNQENSNQTTVNPQASEKKSPKKDDQAGEYVDYEEIP
ncbi:MAG: DUF4834 family protein [Bacteroidia bacterium]